MYLFLNLTSNQMDKIYLLIYRSASHLFPAKVSVPFGGGGGGAYERVMVLTGTKELRWDPLSAWALLSREVDLALPDGRG